MEKKKPVKKQRVGKFQISIWKQKRVIPSRNDYEAEREVELVRACIQYSRFNVHQGSWQNQQIWCNVDELRTLVSVLDKLNEENESSGGDDSSSSFSYCKDVSDETIQYSARDTDHCVCGNGLDAAYHEDLGIVFWNCFRCFPSYKYASGKELRILEEEWGERFLHRI